MIRSFRIKIGVALLSSALAVSGCAQDERQGQELPEDVNIQASPDARDQGTTRNYVNEYRLADKEGTRERHNGGQDVAGEDRDVGFEGMYGPRDGGRFFGAGDFRFGNHGARDWDEHTGGLSTQLEVELNQNGALGTKILLIGDTVIVGSRDARDAGQMVADRFGEGIRVLSISDREGLEAVQRVQKMTRGHADYDPSSLAKDLSYILLNATPVPVRPANNE